jgi:hypothetical protein
LVKDDAPTQALLSEDVVAQLEAVVQQLASEAAGSSVIVEVQQA